MSDTWPEDNIDALKAALRWRLDQLHRVQAENERLREEVETCHASRGPIARLAERCVDAEAERDRLRAALSAAIRAANLALFVIEKHGVMPNDSWRSGFNADMKIAHVALQAVAEAGQMSHFAAPQEAGK